jgi:hypothetical protein
MINHGLYIGNSDGMGRGVFTAEDIAAEIIVEISPVIIMSSEERKMLDKTLLHDYIFEWGIEKNKCCMALGYVAIYNHSYSSNCEHEMDYEEGVIRVKTVREIKVGQELFINYNGNWNNEKLLWFDAK